MLSGMANTLLHACCQSAQGSSVSTVSSQQLTLHPAMSCSKQLLSATSAAGAFKKWPPSWCVAVQSRWPTMWSFPSLFADFQAQERLCWVLSRRWPCCLPPPCSLVRPKPYLHAVLHGGLAPIAFCLTLMLQVCLYWGICSFPCWIHLLVLSYLDGPRRTSMQGLTPTWAAGICLREHVRVMQAALKYLTAACCCRRETYLHPEDVTWHCSCVGWLLHVLIHQTRAADMH